MLEIVITDTGGKLAVFTLRRAVTGSGLPVIIVGGLYALGSNGSTVAPAGHGIVAGPPLGVWLPCFLREVWIVVVVALAYPCGFLASSAVGSAGGRRGQRPYFALWLLRLIGAGAACGLVAAILPLRSGSGMVHCSRPFSPVGRCY